MVNYENKKKVFVTRSIPSIAVELLKEHFQVEVNEEERSLTKEELREKFREAHGVLCLLTDNIDEELIKSCNNVEVISNYAVGFNNIDVKAASSMGIVVTNTPGVLTDTTAELAWALLFSASRSVVSADRYTREGKFKEWAPKLFLGQEITGKTVGVIGAGRIGQAFAKKGAGFNMKILYHNRTRDLNFEKECNAAWVTLEELLRQSDFVSVHVPLTNETTHLLGEKEFKMMKNTAILINTARGPVVDEKALAKALKEGEIWSAGLDVYENEPLINKELMELENVVLLPHIGSATVETRTKMAEMAAKNIIEVLHGRTAINPVNTIAIGGNNGL